MLLLVDTTYIQKDALQVADFITANEMRFFT